MANNRDLYIKAATGGGGSTFPNTVTFLSNIYTNKYVIPRLYDGQYVKSLYRFGSAYIYDINGTYHLNAGGYNRILLCGRNVSSQGAWAYADSGSDYESFTFANAGVTTVIYNAFAAKNDGSQIVMVGEGSASVVRYSSNGGTSWSNSASLGAIYLQDVRWSSGAGIYVAIGYSVGPTTLKIYTSTNGSTWTLRSGWGGAGTIGFCVAYSPTLDMFVAAATTSHTYPLGYSTTGTSWTAITGVSATNFNSVSDVIWSSNLGLFIAIGTNSSNYISIFYSSNGTSWTAATGLPSSNISATTILESNGTLYAVGLTATYTSTNGTSWTDAGYVLADAFNPGKNSSTITL